MLCCFQHTHNITYHWSMGSCAIACSSWLYSISVQIQHKVLLLFLGCSVRWEAAFHTMEAGYGFRCLLLWDSIFCCQLRQLGNGDGLCHVELDFRVEAALKTLKLLSLSMTETMNSTLKCLFRLHN